MVEDSLSLQEDFAQIDKMVRQVVTQVYLREVQSHACWS